MKGRIHEIKHIKIEDYKDFDDPIIVREHFLKDHFPLHWHNYYELEYILEGSGYQILNGTRFEIEPGVLHFLTPADFHQITVTDPAHPIKLIKIFFRETDIDPDLLRKLLELPANVVLQFCNAEKEVFDSLFSVAARDMAILKNSAARASATKHLLEIILLHILEHLNNTVKSADSTAHKPGDIGRVLSYIQKNFRNRITLQEVAAHCHFSPTYLSKCFHESVGITFIEYVQKQRLEFAAKLLVNTNVSITEICYESGFASLSTFTNSFKKMYALSPSEYRSKHRKL